MKTIIAQFIQSATGAAGWVLHAQRGQDGGHGAQVGLSSGLGLEHHGSLLLQVVGLGTDLSLGLQALNQAGLLPAHLSREGAQLGVFAVGLQAQHLQGLGHDHALLLVPGVGDALEALQAGHSGCPADRLVRDHAAHSAPEDLGGGSEVDGTPLGVGVSPLLQPLGELGLLSDHWIRRSII